MIEKRKIGIWIVLCLVFLTSIGVSLVTAIDLPPLDEMDGIDSTITALSGQRESFNQKMDSGINKIVSDYKKSKSGTIKAMSSSSQTVKKEKLITVKTPEIVNGRVKVYLDLENKKEIRELQEKYDLSDIITTSFSETLAQVNVPVENLEELASEDSVKFIRVPVIAVRNFNNIDAKTITSPVISEGVKIIQADELHKINITGKRVEAAIIDFGFANCENSEMGNITEKISFRPGVDISGEGEFHGTISAEVFYDVAPDVNLSLYAARTSLEFVEAVEYIIKERKDISIISTAIGIFNVNTEGNDISCKAIDKANEQGILPIIAIGNEREEHWAGTATDSDGDGWVEFGNIAGSKDETIDMDIIYKNETMMSCLTWNDQQLAQQDFALVILVDAVTGLGILHIEDSYGVGGDPFESFSVTALQNIGRAHLAIFINKNGNSNTELKLFALDVNMLQHNVYEESITSPATAKGAITIGAINWKNKEIEPYSSQSEKLNFVCPTRVSTWGYGRQGFDGTSAATPHAAGILALLMSAYPEATNEEILTAMQETAIDLGPEGKDEMFGYGIPQAFDAYNYLCLPKTLTNSTINQTLNSTINETNQP